MKKKHPKLSYHKKKKKKNSGENKSAQLPLQEKKMASPRKNNEKKWP